MSEVVETKLAEVPAEPTMQDLQNEYGRVVAQAGEKQYHIKCLQDDLDVLNGRLREINRTAAILKSKEASEAKQS